MSAQTVELQKVVERWRHSQDRDNTIAICRELALASDEPKLVDEIGKHAATHFASQPDVLIEVARMYLGASRLGDAQGLLVSAGKMSPKRADVYRLLGEVLLRRGDAERAAKVLERAQVLGLKDADTRFWHDQARDFVDLQRRSGPQAVAGELSVILASTGRPPIKPSSRPAARATPSAPPPAPSRPPTMSESDAVTVIRKPPPDAPPDEATGPPYAVPASPFALDGTPASAARPITVPPPTPRPIERPSLPRPPPVRAPGPARLPPPVDDEITAIAPLPSTHELAASPAPAAPAATREVLSALAAAGVYEPGNAPAPSWDAAPKAPSRFLLTLAVITALLLASGVGVQKYAAHVRARKTDEARQLDDTVAALLEGGRISELARAENLLSRAFELEPNSQRSALLWVRDRVLRPMQVEGEAGGIDSAINRARQTGVPEAALAFARIASFLAQSDTAAAAALLAEWDTPAKSDPYYQLMAGAALERAGDLRAIERYQLATEREPKLVPARIMLGRALLLEGDFDKGVEVVSQLQASMPERAEPLALRALAWARRTPRGAEPPEAETALSRRDELPLALRSVPSAVEALRAAESRPADVQPALERGLGTANTPALATWLGSLAFQMGNAELARRAALQAVAFSGVYPQARVLAARLALAAGRLDEAVSALSEFDASVTDVAIVRAAVAYERLDPDGVTQALRALSSDARRRPELAALARAAEVLRGTSLDATKLRGLAIRDTAWGEVVALDAALDQGDLALAKELLDKAREAHDALPLTPRRARYLRYLEHPQEAEQTSKEALAYPAARSVLERILLLVAADKREEARALLTKQPSLLGPAAPWASAYVEAKGAHASETRSKAAQLEIPSPSAPLAQRVLAALALLDLRDTKRGPELIRELSKQFPHHPDIKAAAARR